MINLAALERLPVELKAWPQWALAGADKAPLSVDSNGRLFNAGVTRPSEWLNFQQAVAIAAQHAQLVTERIDKDGVVHEQTGLNVGFILHEADPFTVIDLDVKDAETHPGQPELWTTKEQLDFYWYKIALEYDCYTEHSRSGKGLHIITRGKIGPGFRRDGVEVYSQERFIICTGNVVLNRPVRDQQHLLDIMVSQMRPRPTNFELQEVEETEDDWYVLTTASMAANSDKFIGLWQGKWYELGYPSQSEADNALISMLTFYSKSNAQVRRLFRDSALGKREKATKNDAYINRTLKYIRGREAREAQADISAAIQAAELVAEAQRTVASAALTAVAPSALEQVPVQAVQAAVQAPAQATVASIAGLAATVQRDNGSDYPWPPGVLGYIAREMYKLAPRQVREVSVTSAIAMMAGVCGKVWSIPGSGLNLYLTLIAQSGVGKEALHSGISMFIKACSDTCPNFSRFVSFDEIVSGPALIKTCLQNQSFVHISGEWGRKLVLLARDDRGDSPSQSLRTQMTNLYHKSGPTAIVGGITYSSTENNVSAVSGVNYSFAGETTPDTLYSTLTDSMMSDGFLSRFLFIEFKGKRRPLNKNQSGVIDASVAEYVAQIAKHAEDMLAKDGTILVQFEDVVDIALDSLEAEIDAKINATNDERIRQIWNRAGIAIRRLSALAAVADSHHFPLVKMWHLAWACFMVQQHVNVMLNRFESGDIGSTDSTRDNKLASIINEYLSAPVPEGYKVSDKMRKDGIVPRSYLQIRVHPLRLFSEHKDGSRRALDSTIKSMVDDSYLIPVAKDKLAEAYNYHGQAYRVVSLPSMSI